MFNNIGSQHSIEFGFEIFDHNILMNIVFKIGMKEYFYLNRYFSTFIKLYFNKLSVYKTGTIHNLMHNPIRFQSPDQECSLAFRLIASSFNGARIASSGTVSGCLVLARWSGARAPHCGADPLPSVQRLSQIFLVPFQYVVS